MKNCILGVLLGMCFFALIWPGSRPQHFTDIEMYYSLLLALFSLAAVPGMIHSKFSQIPPGFFLFTILGFVIRYFFIDSNSIWLDEYTQFVGSLDGGALTTSSQQQQMPLDYIFGTLSFSIFGFKEIAPRFFPLVFGSLSCGLFYILLRKFLSSNVLCTLGTVIFVFSVWMIRYSVEGRPISIAVLSGLLFYLVIWDLYESKKDLKFHQISSLAAATFFIFCTTFLQNYLFVFVANITLILFLKPSLKRILVLIGTQTAVLALLFPFIISLIEYAYAYQGNTNELKLEGFFSSLGKKYDLLSIFKSTLYANKYIFLLTIPPIFVIFWSWLKSGERPGTIFLKTGFLCSFFMTIFSLTYFVFVDWPIHHRYSIIYFPFLLLLSLVSVENIAGKYRLSLSRGFSLVFLLITFSSFAHFSSTREGYEHSPNWEHLYEIVNKYGTKGDVLLTARYDNYHMWRAPGLISHEFYLDDYNSYYAPFMGRESSQVYYLRELLQRDLKPNAVFLIHFWNQGYSSQNIPEDTFLYIVNQLGILGTQVDGRPWEEVALKQLRLSRSINTFADGYLTFLQMEMEILISMNRQEEAEQVFKLLEQYDMKTNEPDLYKYYLDYIGRSQ